MSVKQALLALLEEGPKYGYQLRAEFEQRTGATWPLNIGQVYTTLTRLERDGLVEGAAPTVRARDLRVTEAGRAEVADWFNTPVARTQPPRDELAIKLALALTVPGVDVGRVIQRQRIATMAALQDYTRLKRGGRAASRRGERHGLEPRARLAGLRRRGRDPLARPLRGPAAPRRRGRPRVGGPRRRPSTSRRPPKETPR